MDPEIASFVFKFQHLCHAGKTANLSLDSKAGKVSLNLNVEIGGLHLPPQFPPPTFIPQSSRRRNGPAQARRHQKRAEERRVFAEEATKELSTEEVDLLRQAERA